MIELSGRDLGIAVAKEVLGWTEWDGLADYDGPYPMFCDYDDHFLVWDRDTEDGDFTRSWVGWEDKNDAWEVLEHMIRLAYEVSLHHSRGTECGPSWGAWLMGRAPNSIVLGYGAICEAILRAALAAARGHP